MTRHGVRSDFAILGEVLAAEVRKRVARAFPALAAESAFTVLDDGEPNLPQADAAVATFWKTAYPLLRFAGAPRKFYFLQDDETLFYPAGSTSAMVEATFRFGFNGICNTVGVLNCFRARAGAGEFFDPCVDPAVFHDRRRDGRTAQGPSFLFCYARPGHPRNCFELVTAALRDVKRRLGDRVRILAAGADWDPEAFGLKGVIENLGVLGYRATGDLYRLCDAGVALMTTCHPSYLPFELMACGSVVIANRNPHTAWLLKDRENCLLAETSRSGLADMIEEALTDRDLRERIAQNALGMIETSFRDWDAQAEKIYRYMSAGGS